MVVPGLSRREVRRDHAVGNEPCCHPMPAEVTGPGVGTPDRAGAVHDRCAVWAPYQAPVGDDHQTTQQVLSEDRSARVTDVPSAPGVTLTESGADEGPEVKVSEGSAAWRVAASTDPRPPASTCWRVMSPWCSSST